GASFVHNYASTDTTDPINPSIVSIQNSWAYTNESPIVFFDLPNKVVFENNYGLINTLGFDFDAGITTAKFFNFARFGKLTVRNNYMAAGVGANREFCNAEYTGNGSLGDKIFLTKLFNSGD